jgi:AmmeMemoRadiSam system protein B
VSVKYIFALAFFGALALGAFAFFERAQPAGAFHTSMYYFDNTDFFSASLKPFATTTPVSPRPRIFITNQHVLAASLIAHQFALARDPSVRKVVLVTQNNWNAGRAPVITSEEDWKTPLGAVPVDHSLTEDLIQKNLAVTDESIFAHEHGITGIIPYVAYAFPNAHIVVLVIRDKTPDAQVDALAAELQKQMDKQTVVVGTIDMSHYLPKPVADAHDRMTLTTIQSFNFDVVPTLDIDTAPTLRLILKIAEAAHEQTFVETGHANSADITGDPTLISTTSYLTGYFAKGSKVADSMTHVLLLPGLGRDAVPKMQSIERLFLSAGTVIFKGDAVSDKRIVFTDRKPGSKTPHELIDDGAKIVVSTNAGSPSARDL